MLESSTAGNLPRAVSRNNLWVVWRSFCEENNLSPLLDSLVDKVPLLAAFMRRYRDGRLAIQGKPIRARSVEDVARQIAKAFTELGAPDPRLTNGRPDPRLTGLVRQWKQEDPPPNRVKPVPTAVLHTAYRTATDSGDVGQACLADLLYIGFFFLCRPGEYTAASEGSRPFRFGDVQLWLGPRRLDLRSAPEHHLGQATCSGLTFTLQKNCVPGEIIAIGTSGSTTACATRALARQIIYLRNHGARPTTPLCAFRRNNRWYSVTNTMITAALRASATTLGPTLGFNPGDISARLLRSSGAMAMLCGGIDTAVGRLRGRWKTDTMFRYLTVQAAPLVADVAPRMLRGGDFQLVPGQNVPDPNGAFAPPNLENPPALQEEPAANMAAAAAAIAAANPNAP